MISGRIEMVRPASFHFPVRCCSIDNSMKKNPANRPKEHRRSPEEEGAGPFRARFMRGVKGSDSIFGTPFPQIAFVGRSNVGKSSTLNALLGVSSLARISQTPGKTQEINFFLVSGNTFFVDLPGYGYAKMPEKEAEAIRKHIIWYLTGGEAKPKHLVLIVDVRHELSEYDRELLRIAETEGHPLVVLMNKVDALNQKERSAAKKRFDAELGAIPHFFFSAKSKEGVEEVRAFLAL